MTAGNADDSRRWYRRGVDVHYRTHGNDYSNPHAAQVAEAVQLAVRRWPICITHVLDLAAGAGEVTLALRGRATRVSAIDPYTHRAYRRATGVACEAIGFEQIAAGAIEGRSYSLVVCSFALHLAARSLLPQVCIALTCVCDTMLVITPHKRPTIRSAWGWHLRAELVHQRVRARLYVRVWG